MSPGYFNYCNSEGSFCISVFFGKSFFLRLIIMSTYCHHEKLNKKGAPWSENRVPHYGDGHKLFHLSNIA